MSRAPLLTGDRATGVRLLRLNRPEVLIGLMPGGGATQRLTRAVGIFAAMRLLLTRQPITSAEALSLGLVSELLPDDQVELRAIALATSMSQGPQAAIRAIKETVIEGMNLPLQQGLAFERKAFALQFDGADKTEGITARLEKARVPARAWPGREVNGLT